MRAERSTRQRLAVHQVGLKGVLRCLLAGVRMRAPPHLANGGPHLGVVPLHHPRVTRRHRHHASVALGRCDGPADGASRVGQLPAAGATVGRRGLATSSNALHRSHNSCPSAPCPPHARSHPRMRTHTRTDRPPPLPLTTGIPPPPAGGSARWPPPAPHLPTPRRGCPGRTAWCAARRER